MRSAIDEGQHALREDEEGGAVGLWRLSVWWVEGCIRVRVHTHPVHTNTHTAVHMQSIPIDQTTHLRIVVPAPPEPAVKNWKSIESVLAGPPKASATSTAMSELMPGHTPECVRCECVYIGCRWLVGRSEFGTETNETPARRICPMHKRKPTYQWR